MTKALLLHKNIYKILINNNYNNFTIPEFRDRLLKTSSIFDEKNLARKFVYRQINRLVSRGLLIKIKESGDNKARYVKSELFCSTSFKIKSYKSVICKTITRKPKSPKTSSLMSLEHERNELTNQLEITLSEVDAYNELAKRFPEEELKIANLKSQAKKSASSLTGKLNAISNLLN